MVNRSNGSSKQHATHDCAPRCFSVLSCPFLSFPPPQALGNLDRYSAAAAKEVLKATAWLVQAAGGEMPVPQRHGLGEIWIRTRMRGGYFISSSSSMAIPPTVAVPWPGVGSVPCAFTLPFPSPFQPTRKLLTFSCSELAMLCYAMLCYAIRCYGSSGGSGGGERGDIYIVS